MLDDRLDLHDPVQMGLRTGKGARLPAPDVYDLDLEYTTPRIVDALHARGAQR